MWQGALPLDPTKGSFEKKMIACDHRVCLGGSTPPFRASRKRQTSSLGNPKPFGKILAKILTLRF
jgi:hypothetical protein